MRYTHSLSLLPSLFIISLSCPCSCPCTCCYSYIIKGSDEVLVYSSSTIRNVSRLPSARYCERPVRSNCFYSWCLTRMNSWNSLLGHCSPVEVCDLFYEQVPGVWVKKSNNTSFSKKAHTSFSAFVDTKLLTFSSRIGLVLSYGGHWTSITSGFVDSTPTWPFCGFGLPVFANVVHRSTTCRAKVALFPVWEIVGIASPLAKTTWISAAWQTRPVLAEQ